MLFMRMYKSLYVLVKFYFQSPIQASLLFLWLYDIQDKFLLIHPTTDPIYTPLFCSLTVIFCNWIGRGVFGRWWHLLTMKSDIFPATPIHHHWRPRLPHFI